MGFDHPDYLGEGEGIRTLDTLMSCLGDTANKSGMQYSKGAEVVNGNGKGSGEKEKTPFYPVKLPVEGDAEIYYLNLAIASSAPVVDGDGKVTGFLKTYRPIRIPSEQILFGERPISAEELSQLRAYIRARIMMLFENSLQTATPVDEKAKDRIGASLLNLLDLDDADFNAAIADKDAGVLTLLKRISDFNETYFNLDASLAMLEKIAGGVRTEAKKVFRLTDLTWEKDEDTQSKDRRGILTARLEYLDVVDFAVRENPRLIESARQRFPSLSDRIVQCVDFLMKLTAALKIPADTRAIWFCRIFNEIDENQALTDQAFGSKLAALQQKLSEEGMTEQKVEAAISSF